MHQLHRRLEVRPGRQQDHRQVRVARPDLAEQGHAFLAGGGLAVEVHVLDHEVSRLALEQRQARRRGGRAQHARTVQRQQHLEGGAHRLAVVDDEDGVAAQVRVPRRACLPLMPILSAGRCAHTVRVATDGDTAAARRAGCQAASWPMPHSSSTPPTR